MVEGGGGKTQELAVREDMSDEGEHSAVEKLASGAANRDEGLGWFRSGAAMVVVTPTLPGRGVENEGMLSTGNSEVPREGFPWHTPSNTNGQDYGGALTIRALDMVSAVALHAIDDLVATASAESELEDVPTRLVVLSTSNGLTTAARWITSTEHAVHALVDYEGSTDSMEQTKGSWSIDPFDQSEEDLPAEPSFEGWGTGFAAGIDTFYFRPPREVLDLLPDEESLFESSTIAREHPEHWEQWYGMGAYDPEVLASEQSAFWDEREAAPWLVQLQQKRCAYVRLQNAVDHTLPSWLMQRHAIRAMNAALAGGEHPHVYFTDVDGYLAASETREDATPTHFQQAQDDDDWRAYRAWWPDGALAWTLKVDLVRWAMEQELEW